MKLPTDVPSETDQQSSSTEESSPSGAEGSSQVSSASSSTTPSTDESTDRPAQASSGRGPSASGGQDVDFSEYLWMENEEEFDSQVLQELEDEEMINYYYELYEASLNGDGTWGPNTANLTVTGPPPPRGFAPSAPIPPQGQDPVDSLTQGLSNRLNLGSRLNPEAAEFVPRTSNMSTPN